jgi:hypothetical protein
MKHIHSRTGLGHSLTRKVKVYDVEKKKLILEFDTMHQAEKELGVKNVQYYLNTKYRCYKNNLGITICFR